MPGPPHSRDWVSPPTRGWTSAGWAERAAPPGFPAHAGMDPATVQVEIEAGGFPRPRGDGPGTGYQAPIVLAVSPPTRGWTPGHRIEALADGGFPAHAGMDRHTPGTARRAPWFPRPRGDGPTERSPRVARGAVSPPTRGWTRSGSGQERGLDGFPAHAGMDRKSRSCSARTVRFPRPRGDGPWATAS